MLGGTGTRGSFNVPSAGYSFWLWRRKWSTKPRIINHLKNQSNWKGCLLKQRSRSKLQFNQDQERQHPWLWPALNPECHLKKLPRGWLWTRDIPDVLQQGFWLKIITHLQKSQKAELRLGQLYVVARRCQQAVSAPVWLYSDWGCTCFISPLSSNSEVSMLLPSHPLLPKVTTFLTSTTRD